MASGGNTSAADQVAPGSASRRAGVCIDRERKLDVVRSGAFINATPASLASAGLASGHRWKPRILEAGIVGRPAAQSAADGVGMLSKVPEGLSRTFSRFGGHAITVALPSTSGMSMNPPLVSRCARESAE